MHRGAVIGAGIDVGQVEVGSETRGQRIERGRCGAHHGREDPRDDQAAQADREIMDDEVGEDLVVRNIGGTPAGALVIKEEQDSYPEEGDGDRDVRQTAQDE